MTLKEYTYVIYAGVLLGGSVIFIVYMPETSGLSVNLLAKMLSFGFAKSIYSLQKQFQQQIAADLQTYEKSNDSDHLVSATANSQSESTKE